jgi:hypothetical protein
MPSSNVGARVQTPVTIVGASVRLDRCRVALAPTFLSERPVQPVLGRGPCEHPGCPCVGFTGAYPGICTFCGHASFKHREM